MSSQLNISEDNKVVIYAVVIAAIFFLFILPCMEKKEREEEQQIKENMTSLINEKLRKLDTNNCSRDCCLHTQWPAPHMPKKEPSDYVGSNFMCNGGRGGGCLCVTKDDKNYLSERANNFKRC